MEQGRRVYSMASATIIKQTEQKATAPRYQLSVNAFDRTATLVIALLVIIGATVFSLSIIFFANKFTSTVEPIAFVPVEASSPNANQGIADQPEPPGVEDAPELVEPQLQDTLDALSMMSLEQALMVDEAIDAAEEAGKGEGLGDSRQAGPGGDGVVERVPRWERWKIRFEPKSSGEFAEWLDQFGIRVGVLGRDNKVHVAWDFSKGAPQVESKPPLDYNAWGQTVPADGPMPKLTADLARKAGIMQRGPIALLFYPFEVESRLWTLEQAANKLRDPNKIRETVFTVIRDGGGFKFEVVDMKYF
jgi:hypothetical protein